MRAVIQRVTSASVTVEGQIISQIGKGLCVLVGISRDDTEADSDYIVNKILKLCLFEHPESGKRWSSSVVGANLEILCVSQFTLYTVLKGNKPDFHQSMGAERSKHFYERFLEKMRTQYRRDAVFDGQFGALMQVNIVNDGPVTINLQSPTNVPTKQHNQLSSTDTSTSNCNNNNNN